MAPPVLFDAATLVNFAVVDALALLEGEYGHRPPHWTAVVRQEIADGYNLAGVVALGSVLSATWLGRPLEPKSAKDRKSIAELHIGLNGGVRPPVGHAGEAESIHFALQLGAVFVTDDRPAAAYADRKGVHVLDTVDVLRALQVAGTLSCDGAWELAVQMMDVGRTVRRNRITKKDICAT